MGFTTTGKNNCRDYLAGSSPTSPTHLAMGLDNTAFNVADIALIDETTRIALDNTSTGNKKVSFEATLNSATGNGNTFKEVGILNASSAGTLFQRNIFNGIDKDANIELKFIITVRLK